MTTLYCCTQGTTTRISPCNCKKIGVEVLDTNSHISSNTLLQASICLSKMVRLDFHLQSSIKRKLDLDVELEHSISKENRKNCAGINVITYREACRVDPFHSCYHLDSLLESRLIPMAMAAHWDCIVVGGGDMVSRHSIQTSSPETVATGVSYQGLDCHSGDCCYGGFFVVAIRIQNGW